MEDGGGGAMRGLRTRVGQRTTDNGQWTKNKPKVFLSLVRCPLSTVRILLSIVLLFLVTSPSLATPSKHPAVTPTQAVKDLDQKANQYKVGKNLSGKDRALNRQLKKEILRGTFNLRELARLALDKHWAGRNAREQNYFVELLTALLEERSVFAKEKAEEKGAGQSYVVSYKKEKFLNKEKTVAHVFTKVRLVKHRTTIDLDYKLKRMNEEKWQIYDVIVDEASLVANYRSSFDKIITKHSYAELVKRMQNKLKEFRAKRT